MKRLQDRVAVITGGSSGIGKATAIRLAEEGAKVVVADLDPVSGEKVAAQVGGIFVKADVTNADDVANMYKVAFDTYFASKLHAKLTSHCKYATLRGGVRNLRGCCSHSCHKRCSVNNCTFTLTLHVWNYFLAAKVDRS